MGRFVSRVVVDDNGTPLAGAVGQVYDITDTTNSTPLAISTIDGLPITGNQLVANNDGVTPEFQCTGKIILKWVSGAYTQLMLAYDLIPSAGTTGQVLQKLSGSDWDLGWGGIPGVPVGGSAGQVLTKKSGVDFDTIWSAGAVNVKTLGALGNGSANDRAIIQGALDAGGAIYIPMGDYGIDAPLNITQDGTVLICENAGQRVGATQGGTAVRIKALAGYTGGPLIRVQRTANDRPLSMVNIHHLAVDGNNQAATEGILFRASQSSMNNVNVWNCSSNALRVQGYVSPNWDTYDTRFRDCLFAYCGGSGIFLDNNSSDLHFTNCVVMYNQDGVQVSGGSSHQFDSCHFYSATRYNVFFNGSGSRTKFSNCKIEGGNQHQVNIDTTNGGYSDIQFTGCGVSTVDQGSATNTWDLVIIQGPSANGAGRTTFSGCNFNLKGGSTVKPRFGINLATSAAQGTVICGNSFGPASHWGTAPINNASASSVLPTIRDNGNCPDVILPNVKTASYTLTADDAMGFPVEMNSATAVTVTVPPNAQPGFFKGNVVTVVQTGAGQVTFAPGAGVTLRTPRSLTTRAQYSTVHLRQMATNVWILEGDLT